MVGFGWFLLVLVGFWLVLVTSERSQVPEPHPAEIPRLRYLGWGSSSSGSISSSSFLLVLVGFGWFLVGFGWFLLVLVGFG